MVKFLQMSDRKGKSVEAFHLPGKYPQTIGQLPATLPVILPHKLLNLVFQPQFRFPQTL
jgi:hypothetical protein